MSLVWKLEYPEKLSKKKRLAVVATLRLAALETADVDGGVLFRETEKLLLPEHLRLLAFSLCHRLPGSRASVWTGNTEDLIWIPATKPKEEALPSVLQDLLNPSVVDPIARLWDANRSPARIAPDSGPIVERIVQLLIRERMEREDKSLGE